MQASVFPPSRVKKVIIFVNLRKITIGILSVSFSAAFPHVKGTENSFETFRRNKETHGGDPPGNGAREKYTCEYTGKKNARKNAEKTDGENRMNKTGGKKNTAGKIFCGAATGAANGIFGGGGGMIAVPLLRSLGLSEKRAHATAISVILPVSLLSFILYAIRGFFDFKIALPTALGSFAGGFLGAKLLSVLPEKIVFLVFTSLQLFAGLWLVFS